MMGVITPQELTAYLQTAFPDASVDIVDRTGTLDHFTVRVSSQSFEGVGLLDRHRMVYQALENPMGDRRIHALEIKAMALSETG